MNHIKRDLMILLVFFVLLFIGWVAAGGPEEARNSGSFEDKFIKPVAPLDTGETYDKSLKEVSPIKIQKTKNAY